LAADEKMDNVSGSFQQAVVDLWKTRASQNYGYFEQVQDQTDGFWAPGQAFRTLFDKLDRRQIVEIACGQGRHSVLVPRDYESLLALDTSVDGIEEAKRRYGDLSRIKFVVSQDGISIPVADDSQTAIFSYDAMVHFEPLTINSYLAESARILPSGGRGLFHHSNYDQNPTGRFTDSPNWRNYMTRDLFAHFCSRHGLNIIEQVEMDWGQQEKSDCLSLFQKI
jgi:ubiquinone/menaquinone biosynthesis C-methylase UbiE